MTPLTPLPLAHLPTPLEEAPALGRRLGIDLFIKRDDCTGLATGGNKARKLAWIAADAAATGADTLVTFGGVQSNHARMTAAAAARAGMRCTLLLAGSRPDEAEGNLLLDRILGADIEYLGLTPSSLTGERVRSAFDDVAARLRSAGRTPRVIPAGGSEPLGVAACALAWIELAGQMEARGLRSAHVVVCVGTGGTLAGLVLGNLMTGRRARITAISSAPPGMPAAVGVAPLDDLVRTGAAAFGLVDPLLEERARRAAGELHPEDLRVDYGACGAAYGAATRECVEAIRTTARCEGLLLDPVYTGKAMAGLIDAARRGAIAPGESVIFWHTGGAPGIFPYAADLLGTEPAGLTRIPPRPPAKEQPRGEPSGGGS